MFNALKSEFTKTLTLRSTYIVAGAIALLAVLIGVIVAVFADITATPGVENTDVLNSAVQSTVSTTIAIFAIVASLSILNEYRHGTMAYTITASRSRYTVFITKIIVTLACGLAVSLIASIFAVLAATIGLAASGGSVSSQAFDVGGLLLHEGLHVSFYILVGLFLGFILRNIIIVIVIIFVVPAVENLSSLVLKEGAQYLPFSSFGAVGRIGEGAADFGIVLVAFVYVLALAAGALVLFVNRDA